MTPRRENASSSERISHREPCHAGSAAKRRSPIASDCPSCWQRCPSIETHCLPPLPRPCRISSHRSSIPPPGPSKTCRSTFRLVCSTPTRIHPASSISHPSSPCLSCYSHPLLLQRT